MVNDTATTAGNRNRLRNTHSDVSVTSTPESRYEAYRGAIFEKSDSIQGKVSSGPISLPFLQMKDTENFCMDIFAQRNESYSHRGGIPRAGNSTESKNEVIDSREGTISITPSDTSMRRDTIPRDEMTSVVSENNENLSSIFSCQGKDYTERKVLPNASNLVSNVMFPSNISTKRDTISREEKTSVVSENDENLSSTFSFQGKDYIDREVLPNAKNSLPNIKTSYNSKNCSFSTHEAKIHQSSPSQINNPTDTDQPFMKDIKVKRMKESNKEERIMHEEVKRRQNKEQSGRDTFTTFDITGDRDPHYPAIVQRNGSEISNLTELSRDDQTPFSVTNRNRIVNQSTRTMQTSYRTYDTKDKSALINELDTGSFSAETHGQKFSSTKEQSGSFIAEAISVAMTAASLSNDRDIISIDKAVENLSSILKTHSATIGGDNGALIVHPVYGKKVQSTRHAGIRGSSVCTTLDLPRFWAKCSIFAAAAVLKTNIESKDELAQKAAETVLRYCIVHETDELSTEIEKHLQDVAAQISLAVILHPGGTREIASIVSLEIINEGNNLIESELEVLSKEKAQQCNSNTTKSSEIDSVSTTSSEAESDDTSSSSESETSDDTDTDTDSYSSSETENNKEENSSAYTPMSEFREAYSTSGISAVSEYNEVISVNDIESRFSKDSLESVLASDDDDEDEVENEDLTRGDGKNIEREGNLSDEQYTAKKASEFYENNTRFEHCEDSVSQRRYTSIQSKNSVTESMASYDTERVCNVTRPRNKIQFMTSSNSLNDIEECDSDKEDDYTDKYNSSYKSNKIANEKSLKNIEECGSDNEDDYVDRNNSEIHKKEVSDGKKHNSVKDVHNVNGNNSIIKSEEVSDDMSQNNVEKYDLESEKEYISTNKSTIHKKEVPKENKFQQTHDIPCAGGHTSVIQHVQMMRDTEKNQKIKREEKKIQTDTEKVAISGGAKSIDQPTFSNISSSSRDNSKNIENDSVLPTNNEPIDFFDFNEPFQGKNYFKKTPTKKKNRRIRNELALEGRKLDSLALGTTKGISNCNNVQERGAINDTMKTSSPRVERKLDNLALGTKKGIDVNEQSKNDEVNKNKSTSHCSSDETVNSNLEKEDLSSEEDTICYDDIEVYLDELHEFNIKVGENEAKKVRFYADVDLKIPSSINVLGQVTNVPRDVLTAPDNKSLREYHMVSLQCDLGKIPLKIPLKKAFLKKLRKKRNNIQ